MGQKIRSVYKLVTIPILYETIQNMLGWKKAFCYLAIGPLKTQTGDSVLDLGCGPSILLEYYDSIYIDNQNFIALNDLESGKSIRTSDGYKQLINKQSVELKTEVISGMLNAPYNHCCNIATMVSA